MPRRAVYPSVTIHLRRCDDPGGLLDPQAPNVVDQRVRLPPSVQSLTFPLSRLGTQWENLHGAMDQISSQFEQVNTELQQGVLSQANKDFAHELANAADSLIQYGQNLKDNANTLLNLISKKEESLANPALEAVHQDDIIDITSDEPVPGPSTAQQKNVAEIWICEMCGDGFDDRETMEQCMSTHAAGLQCVICNKVFPDAPQMLRHLDWHDLGPFYCDQCGLEFGERAERDKHLKQHTRYYCELCNKSYSTKYLLQGHMPSHFPDQQYQCGYCDQNLPTPGAKRQHESRVHAQDPRRKDLMRKKGQQGKN